MSATSEIITTSKGTYPQYISNRPEGEDMFEGKSQERLANAIAVHIKETDSCDKSILPRLIGVEGKWGSGKSNVIQILEDKLKDTYTFFTFDAWGNQEDLQRRSILELLTKHLITEKKLAGNTRMKVMKPEGDGRVEEIECSWNEKLESLLSRKSYTRDITVPSFNTSTKWFVLTLVAMGLVIAYLSVDNTCHWLTDLLIALSPLIIFALGMPKSKKAWSEMFAMYNTSGKSDTTSYVISEQEPSVREFKEWMTELSNGIPNNTKLVLVFDNMDRLSSEKVHQFWSLVQTFFAGKDYNNIWCIIPYDEDHLASAFSDAHDESEQHKLLRCFLDKTFPVVYRVPEPIVSDYMSLFAKLLDQAYADTILEHEKVLINRCYRHLHPIPNVREIISFINRTVTLRKQWQESIHPLSIAIYALRESELLHHPYIEKADSENEVTIEKVTTEEYILSGRFSDGILRLLDGENVWDYLKKEISALVYGIEPQDALQIVIKRYIKNCFSGAVKNGDLNAYVDNPQFVSMLNEEVYDMEVYEYARAVELIDRIDTSNLDDVSRCGIAEIWKFLGKQYRVRFNKPQSFSKIERIVFVHLSEEDAKMCSSAFCEKLLANKDVSGGNLFTHLEDLFNADFASTFDASKVCPATKFEAARYLDFVKTAAEQYSKYPITTDPKELNKVLIASIGERFEYFDTLRLLKDDESYNVKEVADYAVAELNKNNVSASVADILIRIQRIFFDRFQSQLDDNYTAMLWQEVKDNTEFPAHDEIYSLRALTSMDQLPDSEHCIDLLCERALFYTTTTMLLKDTIASRAINCRRKLVTKMIQECLHDENPDYLEFIENWENLRSITGLDFGDIIRFADSWGVRSISGHLCSTSFISIFSEVWIDALKEANVPISEVLLEKCVADLASQPPAQYIQAGSFNHTGNNWDRALGKLVDTPYITGDNMGRLNEVAVQLLDVSARVGRQSDACWNALLQKVNYASISAAVVDIKTKILNRQSGYEMTPGKFVVLHRWLKLADMASRRVDAANFVLGKIVDDADCQKLILADKDYYAPMIAGTVDTASELHTKLNKILSEQGKSEFAQYIRGLVNLVRDERES